MTVTKARERIAWAVSEMRRNGGNLAEAHKVTGVTTDVIRKACKAEGVHVQKDGRWDANIKSRAPPSLYPIAHVPRPKDFNRYAADVTRRIYETQSALGKEYEPQLPSARELIEQD